MHTTAHALITGYPSAAFPLRLATAGRAGHEGSF